MRLPVRALLLLVAIPLFASHPGYYYGDPFPLTNTRYGSAEAKHQKLVSDGRDFYLFWSTSETIYMTRLGAGPEIGRPTPFAPAIDTGHGTNGDDFYGEFDVAWSGTHFVIAAYRRWEKRDYVFTTAVERSGQVFGGWWDHVPGHSPRIAVGARPLLLWTSTDVFSRRLTFLGETAPPPDRLATPKDFVTAAVAGNASGLLALAGDHDRMRAFVFDPRGTLLSSKPLAEVPRWAPVTLASNGRDYLAAWCDLYHCEAVMLDSGGNVKSSIWLPGIGDDLAPRAVWNGSGWTIAYAKLVVTLDRDAKRVLAEDDAEKGTQVAATSDGRVAMSWGPLPGRRPTPVLYAEPGRRTGRIATFAANEQLLLATLSSREATIVLWLEKIDGRSTLHAGLRSRFGDWYEREIAPQARGALVETDGEEFVVVVNRDGFPSTAMALGNDGRRSWSVRLPFAPSAMTWSGQSYALVAAKGGVTAVRLTRDGVVGRPVMLAGAAADASEPRIASNGNGFLVAFLRNDRYDALRLRPDFTTIAPVEIAGTDLLIHSPGLLWNGRAYVATWIGSRGIMAAEVLPQSCFGVLALRWDPLLPEVTAARVGNDTAIAWRGSYTENLRFLGHDYVGGWLRRPQKNLRLTTLPDGSLAVLRTAVDWPGARDGRGHVSITIGSPVQRSAPAAPQISVHSVGNIHVVEWSDSGEDVDGYRVEYRPGDGVWLELERWFHPREHSASITGVEGVPYTFRVRAFSDGGASRSNEATP